VVGVVKLYDKRHDLIFPTVNFPFISQHFHMILQIVALLLFVCLSVFFLSVFVTSYCDVSHSDDGIYKITSPVFCQAQ
jgi:hypothetical protein